MAEGAVGSGVMLEGLSGCSLVRLRLPMPLACEAGRAWALLPIEPLRWSGDDPRAIWMGPDQWLLVSATESGNALIERCTGACGELLHAATDVSSALTGLALSGSRSRRLLAMGCGLDLHAEAFRAGHCARTRFAQIPVLIVAIAPEAFELYVDRSYRQYLWDWLAHASRNSGCRRVQTK